jgi:hypothetical protein
MRSARDTRTIGNLQGGLRVLRVDDRRSCAPSRGGLCPGNRKNFPYEGGNFENIVALPLVGSRPRLARGQCWRGPLSYSTFTARAARMASVISEIDACSIIRTLAQRDSTGTSVGEKAVLVLKARNR